MSASWLARLGLGGSEEENRRLLLDVFADLAVTYRTPEDTKRIWWFLARDASLADFAAVLAVTPPGRGRLGDVIARVEVEDRREVEVEEQVEEVLFSGCQARMLRLVEAAVGALGKRSGALPVDPLGAVRRAVAKKSGVSMPSDVAAWWMTDDQEVDA